MNFLHTYNPEPVVVTIGSFGIHWYSIIIAIAIISGLLLALKLAKKREISENHIYNLLLIGFIFGLIGGRIGHIIGEWDFYSANISDIFKIWNGGIAIQGILISGLISAHVYSKIKKISFWRLTDIVVVVLPLMQAIGRWGNYFNQELFGLPTGLSFGIPINLINRPFEYINNEYFHPVFLYESSLMLILFFVLLILFNKNKLKLGRLTLIYFISFSLIRFSIDFIKIDLQTIGPLLTSQWVSILIFVTAMVFYYKLSKKELN